jgi:hypothetical protein
LAEAVHPAPEPAEQEPRNTAPPHTGSSPPPAPREEEAPAPAPSEAAGRSLRRLYTIAAAVIGIASSATALLFTLAPDLRPTGRAPAQSAALSDLRVNPDATYGQYLARIDQPRAGFSDQQLGRRGALLDFRVRVEGFKGTTLLLKWELFDDETGREVNESKAIRITPTNQVNEATWQFWVPLPPDSGRYIAIVELMEQKEHHLLKLASLETTELRGLRAS